MNNSVRKKSIVCFSLIPVVLILDQVIKIWVKTHFAIGDGFNMIGDWCRILFVENEGIAFGISFGDGVGKLILTLFRLVASVIILILLIKWIKKDHRMLFLVSISLIFVGAVGNLIDSCFYGLVFSESSHNQIATLFPDGGGYGNFLYGRVVDMFFFPLFEWNWPEWLPWLGGEHAEFFNAIFNLADSAVCVGVVLLVIDQLKNDKKKDEKEGETTGNKDYIEKNDVKTENDAELKPISE